MELLAGLWILLIFLSVASILWGVYNVVSYNRQVRQQQKRFATLLATIKGKNESEALTFLHAAYPGQEVLVLPAKEVVTVNSDVIQKGVSILLKKGDNGHIVDGKLIYLNINGNLYLSKDFS